MIDLLKARELLSGVTVQYSELKPHDIPEIQLAVYDPTKMISLDEISSELYCTRVASLKFLKEIGAKPLPAIVSLDYEVIKSGTQVWSRDVVDKIRAHIVSISDVDRHRAQAQKGLDGLYDQIEERAEDEEDD